MSALTNTYQEIALERPHRCSGCEGSQFLSHSHLIPRSYRKDLECVKENIVYHCLDMAKGCHTKWEGMKAPLLKDFIVNMIYVAKTDRTYFWKKIYALMEHWGYNPVKFSTQFTPNPKTEKEIAVNALHELDKELAVRDIMLT